MSRSLLRTMSIGEVLDAGFTLYRRHFLDWVKIALVTHAVPIALLVYDHAVAWLFVTFVSMTWMSAAVMRRSSGLVVERPESVKTTLLIGLKKWFPLLAAAMFMGVVMGLAFLLFIVPGIILTAMWFAWMAVMVIEDDWSFPSRSSALAKGAWGKILVVRLVAGLIVGLPSAAIGVYDGMTKPPVPPTDILANMTMSTPLLVAAQMLLIMLVQPFSVLVDTMLYYDRRVAVEGLDVELKTRDIGAGADAV